MGASEVSDLETSNFSQDQASQQIDEEIAEKGRFRTETK